MHRMLSREQFSQIGVKMKKIGMVVFIFAALVAILEYLGIFPAWRASLAHKESRIIDQSVTSNNQSGGITAHTILTQRPERHFDTGLRAQIMKALPARKEKILVQTIINDSEAYQFGAEIANFLRSDGWDVDIGYAIWNPPFKGQRLLKNENGILTIQIGGR